MKKWYLLFTFFFPLSLFAQKAPAADPEWTRINKVCDQVLTHIADSKRQEAMELIWMNTSIMGQEELDTIAARMEQSYPAIIVSASNVRQPLLVHEREITGFARERLYMLRLDRDCLFVFMQLYKGAGKWQFSNFNVTDELPLKYYSSMGAPIPDADKKQIDLHCDRFMKFLSEGKVHEAFGELGSIGSSALDAQEAETQSIVTEYFPGFGKFLGYKLIQELKVNNCMTKRFYSYSFEQFFLVFTFTTYKGNTGWRIAAFEFNAVLPSELMKKSQ